MRDDSDLMRKFEYAWKLYETSERPSDLPQIVRDALYSGGSALPGRLALAVAQLAVTFKSRIRLVTFNFDMLLENALYSYFRKRDVISCAIKQLSKWQQAKDNETKMAVLHLHGLIASSHGEERGGVKGPIIISESSYIKNRSVVQNVLKDALNEGIVLFVGCSLNDPNVTYALHESSKTRQYAYALLSTTFTVDEDEHPDQALDHHDQLINQKIRYFETELRTRIVTHKSFAQVIQTVRELSMAAANVKEYLSDTADASKRYGFRFTRALKYAYSALEVPDDKACPEWPQADRIRDRLAEALTHPDWGTEAWIKERRDHLTQAHLTARGLSRTYVDEEEFALFLWLRCRSVSGRPQHDAGYGLQLVGNSAYSHREAWSGTAPIRIGPPDKDAYPAARAAYEGSKNFLKLLSDVRPNLRWRAILAMPITWVNPDNKRDKLLLGVITLNSNRHVMEDKELQKRAKGHSLSLTWDSPSILSLFSDAEMAELWTRLARTGTELVTLPRPSN